MTLGPGTHVDVCGLGTIPDVVDDKENNGINRSTRPTVCNSDLDL